MTPHFPAAIGDGRLASQRADNVTFRVFDYRTDQYINLEMTKIQFVEAYARHILPARMQRVRFAGLFRSAGRPARMEQSRLLLHESMEGCQSQLSLGDSTESHDSFTTKDVAPQPAEASSENEPEVKIGMYCCKCETKMELISVIEGPITCWMMKVSLLVVAWLSQQRIAGQSIPSDMESITQALNQVILRLQEEAWKLGKNQTLELSRCAGMITTELFYDAAHHQFLLAMIAQQLAQLQAAEDRLAERLAAPDRFAARGPPSQPAASAREANPAVTASASGPAQSERFGLLEVQSSESLLPSPLRHEGEKGWG